MHLHIVAFSIPYPPDYGGAIDVYYRLKALSDQGLKVILHSFEYGDRVPQESLNDICEVVHYYPRLGPLASLKSNLPYVVSSRKNKELLQNLIAVEAPILFEGVHCLGYVDHPKLKKRVKLVRAHNIEHKYYENLTNSNSASRSKRLYWEIEQRRLFKHELNLLSLTNAILAISKPDRDYFASKTNLATYLIPAFHPFVEVMSKPGTGNYALFHADLSIPENIDAAEELFELAKLVDLPIIITGKNPTPEFEAKCAKMKNIQLQKNVTNDEMKDLIMDAQVILLHGFYQAGFKLKWLFSLFCGRHCLVPQNILTGAKAEGALIKYGSKSEMIQLYKKYLKVPFDNSEIEKRKRLLLHEFSNEENAKRIISIINDTKSE